MNKIVINTCYGGFNVSDKAIEWMIENGLEKEWYSENSKYNPENEYSYKYYLKYNIPRHHPLLIQVIETLGEEARGLCAELEIREIEGDKYRICEYDGQEWIETPDSIEWTKI